MRPAPLFVAVAATLFCSQAPAAPAPQKLPRYGVFVYSSLCTEKESGDAAGYRLTLMRYGDGDHIVFEWSEGGLYEASGYKVALDEKTSRISFTVDTPGAPQEPAYTHSYSGTISSEALEIRDNAAIPGRADRVPRARDLSRKMDSCPERKGPP